MEDVRATVAALAEWSDWCPFLDAQRLAPRRPGVYLARQGLEGPLVYAGMAGERSGGGGLWRRLSAYRDIKALSGGLGGAAFERALADPAWLRDRLAEAEAGCPRRPAEWGRLALRRADLHLCWATTVDKRSAEELEYRVLEALSGAPLWNRRRPGRRDGE